MPIRAEYRRFYGRDWRRYRVRLIEVRGAWCRDCRQPIAKYANLSHDTHDPETSGVTIRCAACHAHHDAPHSAAVRRRRASAACGQLWLWPPIELPRVAVQGELFG
jgi:RNase P subunit RPR2